MKEDGACLFRAVGERCVSPPHPFPSPPPQHGASTCLWVGADTPSSLSLFAFPPFFSPIRMPPADQVYGDQDMHEVVRKHCMDYLVRCWEGTGGGTWGSRGGARIYWDPLEGDWKENEGYWDVLRRTGMFSEVLGGHSEVLGGHSEHWGGVGCYPPHPPPMSPGCFLRSPGLPHPHGAPPLDVSRCSWGSRAVPGCPRAPHAPPPPPKSVPYRIVVP